MKQKRKEKYMEQRLISKQKMSKLKNFHSVLVVKSVRYVYLRKIERRKEREKEVCRLREKLRIAGTTGGRERPLASVVALARGHPGR